MTEKKQNLSEFTPFTFNSAQDIRIGIVVSEWNDHITESLFNGAYNTLTGQGVPAGNIFVQHVPGSFELPTAAEIMFRNMELDGVICIGCIIQGETRHFEFIANAVAQGIMEVGLKYGKPTVFSVLTCNDMQQAEDRSGGKHGNKGVEGAVSCLKMIEMERSIEKRAEK